MQIAISGAYNCKKTANMTTIGYRAIRYVLLTTKGGGGWSTMATL